MNNLKYILMILSLFHIFIISAFAQNLFDQRVDYSANVPISDNWQPVKCVIDDIDADSFNDVVLLLERHTDSYPDFTFIIPTFLNDSNRDFRQTGDCIVISNDDMFYLYDMVIANLNKDLYPDLAIAGDSLFVLYGGGVGDFTIHCLPYQTFSHAMTMGDIDKDFDNDLIFLNSGSDTAFTVFLNDGIGEFTQTKHFLTAIGPMGSINDIVAIDLNHDDYLDIVILTNLKKGRGILIFLNDKSGDLFEYGFQPLGDVAEDFSIGDFNNDGHYDIAVINISSQWTLSILMGDENFHFTKSYDYEKRGGLLRFYDVITGDFNNDNLVDVATIQDSLYIFINVGNDSFFLSEAHDCRYTSSQTLTLNCADIDLDGDLDIFSTNLGSYAEGGFSIYYNSTITVGIDQHDEILEKRFYLFPNYPNPFNPTTNISYIIEKPCDVNIDICNTLCQKIKTLVHKPQPAGKNTITWNGTDDWGNKVASGIYFVNFRAGSYQKIQKMILMR